MHKYQRQYSRLLSNTYLHARLSLQMIHLAALLQRGCCLSKYCYGNRVTILFRAPLYLSARPVTMASGAIKKVYS